MTLKPRIIIATGKQKAHGRPGRSIATAWLRRGTPTIHVWKPKRFTRWVYEHELAHLKAHDIADWKNGRTMRAIHKEEVRAERIAQQRMGQGSELNDDSLLGLFIIVYNDLRREAPKFKTYIKDHDEFLKFGETEGVLKSIGLTGDEIHRLKSLIHRKPEFEKKYLVTLRLKSGSRKAIFKYEVETFSKKQAVILANENVPADDVIWKVVDTKVELLKK